MRRSADISECGLYRYRLLRRWGSGVPLPFLMLNPSTADGAQDDRTKPTDLWRADDPIGPDNDRRLRNLFRWTKLVGIPVIAAWGVNARPDRVAAVLAMEGAERLQALGVTKAGAPRHPLYLPASVRPSTWPPLDVPTSDLRDTQGVPE